MMQWEKLLNATRLGNRPPKVEEGRSPFNSDHDKVIFSGSFRRLARKTQVHPLATNDHIHNRLTHSLEVACVGRTLGMRVGHELIKGKKLPANLSATDIGDIVQTACLAHDIGNPPFGHTGEEAIRHWFSNESDDILKKLRPNEAADLKLFEGNAQGFRVLTTSEYHPYDGGMRLTYASLGAFIKYPWKSIDAASGTRPKTSKYGVYRSEEDIFTEVAKATGLLKKGDNWYCRHPLAHLMEMADDFCYAILDLEDGIEMGILNWDEVFEIIRPVLDSSKLAELNEDLKDLRPGRKPPLVRGKIISAFVDAGARAFIDNEDGVLRGEVDDLLAKCDTAVVKCVTDAKNLAKERIFQHPRKVELEIGAYNTLATILSVLCRAAICHVNNSTDGDYKSKRALDLIGRNTFDPKIASIGAHLYSREYLALMRVMDFVSGMSDNYATHLARQFNGSGDVR
ncbi:deoxyguanosinetriphosphate triphosphohydrolase [uncultured Stenotrophomonas sp.]|uniref:deoxyguanosinetriphosphate triphosphohydrolase n=1 Tax=uncultured Stenotrophomonas sp. TaxID=165438 RepID=UPI0025DE0850|nr:deoxyguanosinetriphosphate triphosphohydrolase [uncultured Stenotrophomonas sp.]